MAEPTLAGAANCLHGDQLASVHVFESHFVSLSGHLGFFDGLESHFVSWNGRLDLPERLRLEPMGLNQGGAVLRSASKMEWDGPVV